MPVASCKCIKHQNLMWWHIFFNRASDVSLNNVWKASLEDTTDSEEMDINSPLPFSTHFHSTPNYWPNKEQHQNRQYQLNNSYIPNAEQNHAKLGANTEDLGFELFSPLPRTNTSSQSHLSERSSISSFTSQSSQHSSDTDSFLELQSITDNMEKCNFYNNNYMFQSQTSKDSTSLSAFQPFGKDSTQAENLFQPQCSFPPEQSLTSHHIDERKSSQCLNSQVPKGSFPFDSHANISPLENKQTDLCGNRMKTPKTVYQDELRDNINVKNVYCSVNSRADFKSINSAVDANANIQPLHSSDLKPDMKPMLPADSYMNHIPVTSVPNQPASTPVSSYKLHEQKPVNMNVFQPLRVLTRPHSATCQAWSNSSTPRSLSESSSSHSYKAPSSSSSVSPSVSVQQSINQKQANLAFVSVPSKVTPPIYRQSFPLGVRPKFGPVAVDPHVVPVDPKFLLEPIPDRSCSIPNVIKAGQRVGENVGSLNEEGVPVQTVPTSQFLRYPSKVPFLVPAGIPQPTVPGE